MRRSERHRDGGTSVFVTRVRVTSWIGRPFLHPIVTRTIVYNCCKGT
jgi:hypothetical protein